ncbi:MAG: glycosyltransferase, partial [Acetobacteraceae bacterium]|nr:glycosyltransferase [Acetobacteraceae bacterium]
MVIPAYNAERYLEQTIESVLATDVVDRIIVVDDGSTDQTAGILRRLAAEVPALVAVSQPNRGVSAARNAGLAAVTTPFTCFLDADDRFLPGGLAGLQARLLADPEAAAAYGGVDYIDEHGRAIPRRGARPRAKAIGLEDVLQGNFIDTTGAVLLRTDAAVKAGGFNESLRFAEDWELYTRIVLIGPIVPSDATVVEYRQHEQSAMHDADLDFSASHGALAV